MELSSIRIYPYLTLAVAAMIAYAPHKKKWYRSLASNVFCYFRALLSPGVKKKVR